MLKQDSFPRTWCGSLSLFVWMLRSCLWEESVLYISFPAIYCLLCCGGWLCWHLCSQILKEHTLAWSQVCDCCKLEYRSVPIDKKRMVPYTCDLMSQLLYKRTKISFFYCSWHCFSTIHYFTPIIL